MTGKDPVDIGADRQLFVDDFWIDESSGVKRKLQRPISQGVVIPGDKPWDRGSICVVGIVKDEGKYRAWYRCDAEPEMNLKRSGHDTAYAESDDGVHWTKPNLGLFEVAGSKDNNIVWMGPGTNLIPFKDPNPDVPEDERYKGIVRTRDLFAMASPDGINWHLMQEEPIMTEGPFDSPNTVLWDYWREEYVAYTRGVANADPDVDPAAVKGDPDREFIGGVRWIRRSTSKDFISWTPLENIDPGDTPFEHLYTNAAMQYHRAPGTYLMFPMRYYPQRIYDPAWTYSPGVSDAAFMSSRDGINFDRSFMEAFIRPGLDEDNWHDRAVTVNHGMVFTAPDEISLYVNENSHLETQAPRRYTLRTDGFVSVNAGYSGGEFTTRPLTFVGRELELNYATSAVGSVRVEIQDADGNPVDGLTLDDCPEMFADEIEGPVSWKSGGDLSSLTGQPVRLRFALMDADLYAFKFRG